MGSSNLAIDYTSIKDSESVVLGYFRERHPDLDLSPGTGLRETIVKLAASGLNLIRQEAQSAKDSFSVKRVLDGLVDPDAVDGSIIDNLVSNWFVNRKLGAVATGLVKVKVRTRKRYLVPSGYTFTINSLGYVSPSQRVISPDNTTGLLALYESSEGGYYFVVPVVASGTGTEYNLPQGTVLNALGLDPAVTQATAYEDISGGISEESNTELIERAKTAITVRDLNTRKSIPFVLRDSFAFIRDVQTVGYGDPEMQRDRMLFEGKLVVNNPHFGGNIDIYIRTSDAPEIFTLTKTVVDGEVVFSAPDTPIYKIYSAVDSNEDVIDDDFVLTYGTTGDVPHRMSEAFNARFTEFETLTVSGLDNYEGQEVTFRVARPKNLSQVQSFVDSDENRVIACVSVVRAFIPVFVSMNIAYHPSASAEVSETGLGLAIAEYINSIKTTEDFESSEVAAIAQRFPGIESIRLPITIRSELHAPDGSLNVIISENAINIPNRPEICLSRKTVAFFCDPANDITFTNLEA